jgi:predicted DNA-binding transcriptional regulator AlpA
VKRAQREAFRRDAAERRRKLPERLDDRAPGILSTEQVARELGVAPSTIRAYVSREQMPQPSGRFGREPYWLVDAITPWLDQVKARRRERVDTPGSAVPVDE